jgi:DNA-binding PadR family transcriptional regulator
VNSGPARGTDVGSEPSRDVDLSATARVILGMIALDNRTGYDIKTVVDKSTRYFWAASYGQIYPELRRLEQQGLLRGSSQPSGGRARTVYELTDRGRQALGGWLASPADQLFELRSEGMLKLFFSDSLPECRVENLAQMRAGQERKLAQLNEIREHATEMHDGPRLTLELGTGLTQFLINWCLETESRLAAESKTKE